MNSSQNQRYLNIYFQVHQPRRLGQFSFFDIGSSRDYFDDGLNQLVMRRIAKQCYLPTNYILLKNIRKHPELKFTFSISGAALKQMEIFAPSVIDSFKALADTGSVEFLSETYYHSLCSLTSQDEFARQVRMHDEKIEHLFGFKPVVFRNTELIYNDEIGRMTEQLGFKGIFADGIPQILGSLTPNHLYQHPESTLRLFLRNYQLSDDIAFRFNQRTWKNFPLTSGKFLKWLEAIPAGENLVNLGMDYETFGEHHHADSGIFQFLESLLSLLASNKKITMVTPSQAIGLLVPRASISVPSTTSWADDERDLSAWLGNDMQRDAFNTLKQMEPELKRINDPGLLTTWRYLQTSDHFYYMSTKRGDDNNIHNYFSPYPSPYEAFMNYMNVTTDFALQLKAHKNLNQPRNEPHSLEA
jgi:alpha-amylase